jgi:hypothetical protein
MAAKIMEQNQSGYSGQKPEEDMKLQATPNRIHKEP